VDREKTIFRLGDFAHSREIPIFRSRWRSGIIIDRISVQMSLRNHVVQDGLVALAAPSYNFLGLDIAEKWNEITIRKASSDSEQS